jgi:penicillin-binding protein 2
VVSQALQQSAKSASYKNTAWFVGYAPSDNPEIVVAALVQQGEHSAVAVPVVRDVIKAYFDKKFGTKPSVSPSENQATVVGQLGTAILPKQSQGASRP